MFRIGLSALVVSFQLLALTAHAKNSYLTYWYERPTNPDNGAYYEKAGIDLSSELKGKELTQEVLFDTKDEAFEKFGGWMALIQKVRVETHIDEAGEFQKGIAKIWKIDGSTDFQLVSCMTWQRKPLKVMCSFNGFDNITLVSDL